MSYNKWPKRSAEKNYFMVPNEIFSIGLDYHGSHNCHLSDPVCRCVAASRNGRGNTHANPGTRRNRPRTACHRGQI